MGCGERDYSGVGGGRFDLDRVVTRAQIATFLFRVVRFVEGSSSGGSVVEEPRHLVDRSSGGAWSPDGRHLVFSQDGSLWTMDVDSGERSLLVAGVGEYLGQPAWSPDGTRVAYSRGRRNSDGHWFSHIYSVKVDGTAKTQLSDGDVRDRSPDWSPDSERIVFERTSGTGRDDNGDFINADRYVVVMDDTGANQTPLIKGGPWEQSPVWSPDGTRVAYVSDLVWLIDPNGQNPTPTPTGGVFWNGGVSWSPDGRRLAFARTEGDGSSIVITHVDGLNEETVTGADDLDTMPRWSPDGQHLLFTRHQADGTQQLLVVGASGRPSPIECKLRGVGIGSGSGFPLTASAAPSIGRVKLTVLFMDFPNAQATYTTHTEIQNGFSYMVQYLEAMSYGQFDLEVDIVHRWWRASRDFETYLGISPVGATVLFREASAEAVRLADDSYDFSDTDVFATVFPSEHFGLAVAGGVAHADGKTLSGFWINSEVGVHPGMPSILGLMAAHELVHELGLPDLYPFDGSRFNLPDPPPGQKWVYSELGLMGLTVHFASTDRTLDFVGAGRDARLVQMATRLARSITGPMRCPTGWQCDASTRCRTRCRHRYGRHPPEPTRGHRHRKPAQTRLRLRSASRPRKQFCAQSRPTGGGSARLHRRLVDRKRPTADQSSRRPRKRSLRLVPHPYRGRVGDTARLHHHSHQRHRSHLHRRHYQDRPIKLW